MSYFNPLVTNGLSHPYHFDESPFIFRGIRSSFSFLDENQNSKQNSPKWNAIKRTPGLYE